MTSFHFPQNDFLISFSPGSCSWQYGKIKGRKADKPPMLVTSMRYCRFLSFLKHLHTLFFLKISEQFVFFRKIRLISETLFYQRHSALKLQHTINPLHTLQTLKSIPPWLQLYNEECLIRLNQLVSVELSGTGQV